MTCNVETKRSREMEWDAAINDARRAIRDGSDEEIIIISNETGEVLFRYDHHAIKWMEGEFARAFF